MSARIIKPLLLSLACAVLLVVTEASTRESIAINRQHYAEKQLREMVGGAELVKADNGWLVQEDGITTGRIRQLTTDKGYNGRIDFLMATDLSGRIINVRVTDHRETPGLGDKIDIDVSDWITGLSGHALNSRLQLQPDGEIDGITGATITARAMVGAVREGLEP